MAEIDPDLRAAIAAYLSNAVADVPLPELGEGGFEQLVDMLAQGELAEPLERSPTLSIRRIL